MQTHARGSDSWQGQSFAKTSSVSSWRNSREALWSSASFSCLSGRSLATPFNGADRPRQKRPKEALQKHPRSPLLGVPPGAAELIDAAVEVLYALVLCFFGLKRRLRL